MSDEQPNRNRDAIDRDRADAMTRAGIGRRYHGPNFAELCRAGQKAAQSNDQIAAPTY